MYDIKSRGSEALFVETELKSESECKAAADTAYEKYKRIDALFNNAGINDGAGLEKGSQLTFIESLRKNLYHYYYMAHYCPDALKELCGAIVNISSKTAFTGQAIHPDMRLPKPLN